MKLDWKSIQWAIMQLVEESRFDPYEILEIVKLWIKSGFKKDFPKYKKSEIKVNIENDWSVSIYQELEVAKEPEDKDREIDLKEAKKIRKDVEVWEKLMIDVTPETLELSRIAAQAAAQTIKQSLKSIERERFYEKFQNKQGELLKAKVIRIHADNIILDIEWTSVVLGPDGQIPQKGYESWEEIFVLLKEMSKWQWVVTLEITQSTPDYIEAILKKLVPELEEWTVKIEKIVRIAGKKTKIIVSSDDERVDPVWVMVWQKWNRINTVLSLLDGEKIDYIEANNNSAELIAECLKPAQVDKVEIKWNKAYVWVADNQKALAIGKWASNIKLASQITWYDIELC